MKKFIVLTFAALLCVGVSLFTVAEVCVAWHFIRKYW